MKSPPEIAKYLKAGARIAEAGAEPGIALELTGAPPDASYAGAGDLVSCGDSIFDAVVVAQPDVTRELLAAIAPRLSGSGVLVVACRVDPSLRLLDAPAVAALVRTMTEARYSLLSPSRWLERATGDRLFVAARPDIWAIRGYEPGDEKAILSLFETSFGHPRAEAWWRWEFEENPHGQRAISLAFDPEGGLVAQYAAYPVPLRSADRSIDGLCAHQIGDVMTAPKVRGVGRGHTNLLVRTARHFFAAHCARRVAFNFGFLTGSHRSLSSSFVESERVEPVPFRRAGASSLVLPGGFATLATTLLRSYAIEPVASVDEEWDRFFDAVAPAYALLVRRDARHLKWRYFDHPALKYEVVALRSAGELVGWSVFRRRDDTLVWGDALFAPGHARAASLLLRHALASPVGAGASFVECWFPPRPAFFSRVVDRLGLPIVPEPHDLTMMCTPFIATDAAARIARDFYYTACDSDLY